MLSVYLAAVIPWAAMITLVVEIAYLYHLGCGRKWRFLFPVILSRVYMMGLVIMLMEFTSTMAERHLLVLVGILVRALVDVLAIHERKNNLPPRGGAIVK